MSSTPSLGESSKYSIEECRYWVRVLSPLAEYDEFRFKKSKKSLLHHFIPNYITGICIKILFSPTVDVVKMFLFSEFENSFDVISISLNKSHRTT